MIQPTRTVTWGPRDTDLFDVWVPSRAPAGVTVVLIHGGFWMSQFDRTPLYPLASALAGSGLHVALLEFARVGGPDGGWPGTPHSVLAGIEAVAADPALPKTIVAVGHSSGGHLAAWVGRAGRGGQLAGVVLLAGVLDLRACDADPNGSLAIHRLLGGGPDQAPEAWAQADPMRLTLTTPAILLHGDRDADVPTWLSQNYQRARGTEQARCRLTIVPDCEHFGLVEPSHPQAYRMLVRAIGTLAAT